MNNILNHVAFYSVWLFINTYIIWNNGVKALVYIPIIIGALLYFYRLHFKFSYYEIVFIIWMIFVLINAMVNYHSQIRFFYGIYQYIFYPAIIFFSIYIFRKERLYQFNSYMIIMGAIVSIIAIYEYITGDFLILKYFPEIQGDAIFAAAVDGDTVNRAISLAGSPLTLGVMCGIYALITYDRYVNTQKIIFMIMFLVDILGMISTFSRNSWFSFFVAFIIYNYLCLKLKNKSVSNNRLQITIILLFVLILIFFVITDSNVILNRIISMGDFDGINDGGSNTMRMIAWLSSINIFIDNINNTLFGIGVAATGNSPDVIIITESGILKRLVEGGIILAVYYYFMLMYILYVANKLMRFNTVFTLEIPVIVSVVLLILVDDLGLQITEQVNISMLLWLMLGYILSIKEKIMGGKQ